MAKRVSFSEILQEIIINILPEIGLRKSSEMELEVFLNNTIMPVAENINMKLALDTIYLSLCYKDFAQVDPEILVFLRGLFLSVL
jgi:hypothetical protein